MERDRTVSSYFSINFVPCKAAEGDDQKSKPKASIVYLVVKGGHKFRRCYKGPSVIPKNKYRDKEVDKLKVTPFMEADFNLLNKVLIRLSQDNSGGKGRSDTFISVWRKERTHSYWTSTEKIHLIKTQKDYKVSHDNCVVRCSHILKHDAAQGNLMAGG